MENNQKAEWNGCINNMHAGQLIEYLKTFPPDARVVITSDYKDWDCQIAINFEHQRETNTVQLLRGFLASIFEEKQYYPCHKNDNHVRYLEMKAAEMLLHNPDPANIYHCWHYCKECKRTYTHSQADWNSLKNRECCNNPNNLITVSTNIPMVRI